MSFQEEKTYRTAAETLSEASLVFSRGKCAKIFKRVYFEDRKKFASQKICKKRLHLNIWPIFLYEIHGMLAITPKCGKSESSFLAIYLPIPNESVNLSITGQAPEFAAYDFFSSGAKPARPIVLGLQTHWESEDR